MSTSLPKEHKDVDACTTDVGKDVGEGAGVAGAGAAAGKGSPAATVLNARGIPVPAMPGLNGGKLKVGNDVNSDKGGRRPESIRIRATEGVEKLLPQIIASTEKQAKLAVTEEGDKAARAHAEAIRGFRGLVEAGPGTKVTNVLQNPDVEDRCVRAFDAWQESGDGTRLGFLKTLAEALKD